MLLSPKVFIYRHDCVCHAQLKRIMRYFKSKKTNVVATAYEVYEIEYTARERRWTKFARQKPPFYSVKIEYCIVQ